MKLFSSALPLLVVALAVFLGPATSEANGGNRVTVVRVGSGGHGHGYGHGYGFGFGSFGYGYAFPPVVQTFSYGYTPPTVIQAVPFAAAPPCVPQQAAPDYSAAPCPQTLGLFQGSQAYGYGSGFGVPTYGYGSGFGGYNFGGYGYGSGVRVGRGREVIVVGRNGRGVFGSTAKAATVKVVIKKK